MSKTLLLADDSSTIQRVVELTFAEEDIRVITVDDGEQALRSIERDLPDIVLADIGMPRLDGYSVSSHVKSSPELQHIPVLLLAGAFEPIDEDRARAARCDGVLVKPFEPRLLASRVQELLDAARARQAVVAFARATALDGRAVASTDGEPARVVLAFHRADLGDRADRTDRGDRPAPPAFDVTDLDRRLAALMPAPAIATMPADPTASVVAPVPEPPETPETHETKDRPDPASVPARSAKPATAVPTPIFRSAAAGAPQTVDRAAGTLGSKISLATAFAALLAAEQSAPNAGDLPAGLRQGAVEDVVRRVLMSDDAVRKIVLEAAERMVKEEIERLKSSPEPPAGVGPLTE
jgi:CheY-like chemotaxis protein